MAIRWKSSFSCNIREIDNQHKKLFEISSKLNILEPLSKTVNFDDEIREVIHELKSYAQYHFAYEERLMNLYHFTESSDHIDAHQKFIRAVAELEFKASSPGNSNLASEIIFFVNDWISVHILDMDMKYKDFFNQRGIF